MRHTLDDGISMTLIAWILVVMTGIGLIGGMIGCASPADVRPFPLDPTYTERFADPGEIDEHCYTPGGKLDDGTFQKWNTNFCGCVEWDTKTVWIARKIECDLDKVRAHEMCHIAMGSSKAARAMCDKEFHL